MVRKVRIILSNLLDMHHPLRTGCADHDLAMNSVDPKARFVGKLVAQFLQAILRVNQTA